MSLFVSVGTKEHAEALKKFEKHETGVGYFFINKLEDVDIKVLRVKLLIR